VTLRESGVAGGRHCRPSGGRLSKAQLTENGRTMTVRLPGGFLVSIQLRAMGGRLFLTLRCP
jgi:hypothetical protein